jgi:hypothetical protein
MRLALLPLFVGALVAGCSDDNATRLADQVREGASRLSSPQADDSVTVSYEPVNDAPYTVVFFPPRDVPEADLVAAGVNKEIAHRIYKEMAYLGGMARQLVVVQDGQWLQFTTSWKHVAEVQDLVVLPRKIGTAAIDLTREAGTIRVVAIR